MAEYTQIVPGNTPLVRDPTDTSFAARSWQEALLLITEANAVQIETRTYYGGDGTPESEWNGRVSVYTLATARAGSCLLDVERLRRDLAEGGALAALVERIIAGRSEAWDRRRNCYCGQLTQDAEDAEADLQRLVEDTPYCSNAPVWGVIEWLYSGHRGSDALLLETFGLTTEATDDEIAAVVSAEHELAKQHGLVLVGNMTHALRDVIVDARREIDGALLLCRSDAGDGGWSLHAPGADEEEIASGAAAYLVSGDAERDAEDKWNRPNADDYSAARAALLRRVTEG